MSHIRVNLMKQEIITACISCMFLVLNELKEVFINNVCNKVFNLVFTCTQNVRNFNLKCVFFASSEDVSRVNK